MATQISSFPPAYNCTLFKIKATLGPGTNILFMSKVFGWFHLSQTHCDTNKTRQGESFELYECEWAIRLNCNSLVMRCWQSRRLTAGVGEQISIFCSLFYLILQSVAGGRAMNTERDAMQSSVNGMDWWRVWGNRTLHFSSLHFGDQEGELFKK